MLFAIICVLTGSSFGVLMTVFSAVNALSDIPTCIVPFFLKKKYPHACKGMWNLILHNLNLKIHSTAFNEMHPLALKNGQSVYIGKIFGQFEVCLTKLNAYFKAMW